MTKSVSSIRTLLLILVAAIVVPLAGLLVYAIYSNSRQAVLEAKSAARTLAIVTAADTARTLNAHREALATIAKRPLVRAVDGARCDPVLRDIHPLFPASIDVAVLGMSGDLVCSAVLPAGAKAPSVAKTAWFAQAIREDRVIVGEPSWGPISGKWISITAYPLHDDRNMLKGLLVLPLDLAAYIPSTSTAPLAPDTAAGIVTADGTLVWRNLDPQTWIGKKLDKQLPVMRLIETRSVETEGTGLDAVRRFVAVAPVPGSDWYAYVAIPSASIYAAVTSQTTRNALFGLISLLALMGIAVFLSRRITGPLRELVGTIRAIRKGSTDSRARATGVHEVAELAGEFNLMLDDLSEAARNRAASGARAEALLAERQKAIEDLRVFTDNVPVMTVYYDKDLRCQFANKRYANFYGFRVEDILCKHLREIVGEADFPLVENHFERALSGQTVTYERIRRLAYREFVYLGARLVPDFAEGGDIRGCYAMVADITERKRAEEARERLAAIVENSTDAIISRSLDGTITSWNAAAERLLGYSASEAIGKPMTIVLPLDRQKDVEAHSELLRAGRPIRPTEVGRVTKDGRLIDVLRSISPITNERGEIVGAAISMRDVTEQKHADALVALEHTVARCLAESHSASHALRSILHAVCETEKWECGRYYYLDKETESLHLAEHWCVQDETIERLVANSRNLSISPGVGVAGNVWQSGQPLWIADIDADQRATRLVFPPDSGIRSAFAFAATSERKTIGVMIFNSREIREPDERLLQAVVAIGSQVGQYLERKRAEEVLLASEERNRSLLMASPDGIWMHRDGKLRYINDALVRILGYDTADECLGRDIYQFFPPEEREALRARVVYTTTKLMATPITQTVMLRKDGSRVEVETTAASYPQLDRPWSIAIIRDVTERNRIEMEILHLKEDLEHRVAERTAELGAAVKEMEAFTYTVAHDLRSPLRALDAFSKILVEDYKTTIPEEGQKYLVRVSVNARRMALLIDDLLAFSRYAREPVRRQKVDIETLVRSVTAEESHADAHVAIRIGQLPVCECDPALLRQVWVNLISNAVKYSRGSQSPVIEIGYADGAYYVRDNGIGFDMAHAGNLFGVFNRMHRQEDFEGTGVGLAIVKRIVDRHGGRVWAESEVGKGATFYFSLPT